VKVKRKKTITQLLSGHGPLYKKYKGHHVLIAGERIVPLKRGKMGLRDFRKLTQEFGKQPLVLFVPRDDITYILNLCLS